VPYLPAAYYRKVFDNAFGIAGWSLIEAGKPQKIADGYYQAFVFKVGSVPIMKKVGAMTVKGGNEVMTPGNALEAMRSNCEMRVAKELGVARELWWPQWCRKWLRENCVEVDRTKKGIPIMARKDDEAGFDALATLAEKVREVEEMDEYGPETLAHMREIAKPKRANQRPISATVNAEMAELIESMEPDAPPSTAEMMRAAIHRSDRVKEDSLGKEEPDADL